jgi:hypothetical protein
MTILQSLSFILVATADAENPEKNKNVWSILAQPPVVIAVQGIIGNRYKHDSLFLLLVPAIHLPFYKRVDVFSIGNM